MGKSKAATGLAQFVGRDVTITADGGRTVLRGELTALEGEVLYLKRHGTALTSAVRLAAIGSISDDGNPTVRRRVVEEREAVEADV